MLPLRWMNGAIITIHQSCATIQADLCHRNGGLCKHVDLRVGSNFDRFALGPGLNLHHHDISTIAPCQPFSHAPRSNGGQIPASDINRLGESLYNCRPPSRHIYISHKSQHQSITFHFLATHLSQWPTPSTTPPSCLSSTRSSP